MNEPTPPEEHTLKQLEHELQTINMHLRRAYSLPWVFARGLATGFAIVIGSTVLVGIVLSIIRVVFGDIPYLTDSF